MDYRHLIAYVILLFMVAGLSAVWLHATRHRRAARRSALRFERLRRQRRAEAVQSRG